MIYFIQQGEDGPVKIGYSATMVGVERRRSAMQTAHCVELRLLGVVPGDREDETLLHEFLREWRIRGEWFSPSSEVLETATSRRSALDAIERRFCMRRWRDGGVLRADWSLTDSGFEYLRQLEWNSLARGGDPDRTLAWVRAIYGPEDAYVARSS